MQVMDKLNNVFKICSIWVVRADIQWEWNIGIFIEQFPVKIVPSLFQTLWWSSTADGRTDWPRCCRCTGLCVRKGSGRDVSCLSPGLLLDDPLSTPSLRLFTGVVLKGRWALNVSLVMKPFPVGEDELLPLPWCSWARLLSTLGLMENMRRDEHTIFSLFDS